jgi:hypothetical protein
MNDVRQLLKTPVDRRKQEILDESKVWSGCYARAVVAPYGYDKMGNKGVAFGLDAVQILREGEQVAGTGMAAVRLFDEVADDARLSYNAVAKADAVACLWTTDDSFGATMERLIALDAGKPMMIITPEYEIKDVDK